MKNIIQIIFLYLCMSVSGQTVSEINEVLDIPDSLTHKDEIRIYRRNELSNGTDVFRMYYSPQNGYTTEYYEYRHLVSGQVERPFCNKVQVAAHSDPEYIWMKLMATNIIVLPKKEYFQYKKERPIVVCEDGRYVYQVTNVHTSDGVSYKVAARSGNEYNYIEYSNPESYLRRFPGIDELEYFIEY